MRVSRAKAVHKSGPRKGKLRPGCRYIKGDGADCKKAPRKKPRGKPRRKKRRVTGAARRARRGVAPATPSMNRLNAWRRYFRDARSCGEKRKAVRAIKKQLQHMARKPAKPKRGESQGAAATRRWKRWQSEYKNKLEQTEAFCSGRPRSKQRMVGPGMVNGLSATAKKKHPCTRPNPPPWCNK